MDNQMMPAMAGAASPDNFAPAEMQPAMPNTASGGCGCGGSCGGSCQKCAGNVKQPAVGSQFVYVLGRIYPRYPNLGIEKEIAQALGSGSNKGASDEQALHDILRDPNFLYIAREMCWSVAVESIDSYLIKASDTAQTQLLLESLREDKDLRYIDVIIGRVGPNAPLNACNGAMLPVIDLVQLYSFDRASLIKQLPRPKEIDDKAFQAAIKQTLDVVGQMSGNLGLADGHRAVNYLVTRYAELYQLVAQQLMENASLRGLSTRVSDISGSRRVYDVILTFQQRGSTSSQNFSARVDVTDVFPFLVSSLSPYFERG